ncbi:MAG: DUF262 domain-containing protein [Pseudonocardiaceae bacterium]
MSFFNTFALSHNNILSVYVDKERIEMSPEYQRQGDIWSLEKKQLLVDSIINRYDIPKLYFHKYERDDSRKLKKDFAVVDGRQRLETIFGFIDGAFPLAKDFEYLEDDTVSAGGHSYDDLAKRYPRLKQRFDAFALPVIAIETDDLELIEDLFYRLNEAVPLNAAEKRNAIGGFMARAITDVSKHSFFESKVRLSNKRYQHKEVAARLLFLEYSLRLGKLLDTKKPLLDAFVRQFKSRGRSEIASLESSVTEILTTMSKLFVSKDMLLASQSSIPIYYLLARQEATNSVSRISRQGFIEFNAKRQKNRLLASKDLSTANYELLEYDRMSQQGTNDASSIRERFRIAAEYFALPVELVKSA